MWRSTRSDAVVDGRVLREAVPTVVSRRARATASLSAVTLRRLGGALPPEHRWGLWATRQVLAGVMETCGPSLAGVRTDAVDVRLDDGRRVKGEWVRAAGVPEAAAGGAAVLYLHGSGYALCSPRTHRRLVGRLSALTGLPVFTVDYRLAPRHRFPAAADDVAAAFDWLHENRGVPAGRLVVAGDSAGGHLAVDLLTRVDRAHRPAGLVLFSPLIDLTFATARRCEARRRDPVIRAEHAHRLLGLYCRGVDAAHPRLTLDVAGAPPLPPTLVQAGGAEMLADDARALAADIVAAGGHAELEIWPGQVHVFQALPRLAPEAAVAMRRAAAFVGAVLREAHPTAADDARVAG